MAPERTNDSRLVNLQALPAPRTYEFCKASYASRPVQFDQNIGLRPVAQRRTASGALRGLPNRTLLALKRASLSADVGCVRKRMRRKCCRPGCRGGRLSVHRLSTANRVLATRDAQPGQLTGKVTKALRTGTASRLEQCGEMPYRAVMGTNTIERW